LCHTRFLRFHAELAPLGSFNQRLAQ
jgi:hypothetical protein